MKQMTFENNSDEPAETFLYKKRYQEAKGYEPYVVSGNSNDIARRRL